MKVYKLIGHSERPRFEERGIGLFSTIEKARAYLSEHSRENVCEYYRLEEIELDVGVRGFWGGKVLALTPNGGITEYNGQTEYWNEIRR